MTRGLRSRERLARLVLLLPAATAALIACDGVLNPSATAPSPVPVGAPAAVVAGDHVAQGRVRITPPRTAFFRWDDDTPVRFAFAAQLLDSAGAAVALPAPPAWSMAGDGASRVTGHALSADNFTATANTETVSTGRDTLTARHGSASGRSVVTSWKWLDAKWQGRDWVGQGGSDCVLAAVLDRAGVPVALATFHDLHGVSLAPEALALDSLSRPTTTSARLCVRGLRPGSGGLALAAWDTTTFRYGGSYRRHHVLAEPLTLQFVADEWELGVGQEAPLALRVTGSQGNTGTASASEASVSSSVETVATVAGTDGTVVRGVASGSATLSASYLGLDADTRVEVHEIVAVRTGGGATCLLLRRGTVRCAGEEGPLLGHGQGDTGDLAFPNARDVPMGGTPLAALARGLTSYSACGVHENGDIRCWGISGPGKLGYGDRYDVGLWETPADKGTVPVGGRVRSVGMAEDHTCAVMESGAVRCWGDNHAGQLGYGSLEPAVGDDETPASFGDVPLGGRAVQVEGGRLQTCALMETGRVRCWGIAAERWNADAKRVAGRAYGLGYGDRFPHDESIGDDETPASVGDVPLPGRAVKVSVGGYHTCALMASGTVRCWGSAWWGVLGDGSRGKTLDHVYDAAESPELVFPSPVVDLVSHYFHNCVLLADATVRCWGLGDGDALGYGHERAIGDDEPATSAPPVPLGGPVAALAIHYQGGCAVMRAGGLRCWGASDELGFTAFRWDVQVFPGPLRRRRAGGPLLAQGGTGMSAPAAMALGLETLGPLSGPDGVLAVDSLPPMSAWMRAR